MRRRLGMAVICLALLLAGCGSSGPTKTQFIARADAICESALQQERSVSGLPALARVIQHESRQLSALPQPTRDDALLRRFLAAERRFATAWAKVARAGARPPEQLTPRSEQSQAVIPNMAPSLAARYGLADCSGAGATVVSTATTG